MPVVIIAVATFLIIVVMFRDNRLEANENLATLRQDYLLQQKIRIQQEVDSVYRQISYEKKQTEDALKLDLKARIYEAHRIATAIYEKNKEKSEQEITKRITTALRALHFNEGRGYYFIYKMDGTNVMLPPLPHMEGTSRWDMQDSRGAYITRDVINIAKNKGEGYHSWWFFKPGNQQRDHEKVGFIKYFSPMKWMIGTGEYVDSFEKNIQDKLLARISEIRYGSNGYVFVLDENGVIKAHQDKSIINTNRMNLRDKEGNEYIKNIINKAKSGGGFIRYHSLFKPMSIDDSEKVSYVRWFGDWNWTIGTGFYIKDSEIYLAIKEKTIKQQNSDELLKLLIYSAILAFVMTLVAALLSRKVASRFQSFQSKISQDFSELENAKNTMQRLALYDSLTDLPNRLQFTQLLRQAITESDKTGNLLAVILVGLDDFKKINDLYGHFVGDKLLTILSREFEAILDPGDSVCRFGGDEFIFCIQNLHSKDEVERKIAVIQGVFSEAQLINNVQIKSSCSVGVSCYPEDSFSAEEAMSNADISLYRAKSDKKGTVIFFNSAIAKQLEYDFKLESELKGALGRNEISLVYQPQICTSSGKMIGVEALCRWNNQALGFVSPVEFIDVAERIDLIHSIGQFVVEKACSDIVAAYPNGDDAVKLSVNISPKQLKLKHFADDFHNTILRSGIDISRVTIEITENVLLEDQASVTPILHELRELGFSISLDDFGTGFSSLSYLNNLPINEIKIDRSFIDKILISDQSDTLVKAILAIGQSCGMKVVAEGVETIEQYHKLLDYQCDLVQGYYFDKPLELGLLEERTEQHWKNKCSSSK